VDPVFRTMLLTSPHLPVPPPPAFQER
jgi:hypothetical protein